MFKRAFFDCREYIEGIIIVGQTLWQSTLFRDEGNIAVPVVRVFTAADYMAFVCIFTFFLYGHGRFINAQCFGIQPFAISIHCLFFRRKYLFKAHFFKIIRLPASLLLHMGSMHFFRNGFYAVLYAAADFFAHGTNGKLCGNEKNYKYRGAKKDICASRAQQLQ